MSIEMYANVYVTYHMRSVARMVPVTLPGHACSAAGTAVADSLSPSRSTSPATRPVTMAMGCLEGSPQEGSSHPPGWVLGDLVTCLWVQRCSTVKDRKSCCSFWIRFEPLELIRTRWGSVMCLHFDLSLRMPPRTCWEKMPPAGCTDLRPLWDPQPFHIFPHPIRTLYEPSNETS